MFKKTNVPVLGYVSNMSAFVCPSCGTKTPLSSKSKSFSSQTGVELLGDIPFNIEIGDYSDEGNPLVVAKPESPYVSLLKWL
jgi:ATP-binding protein involved in chromosome partitioning